MQRHDLLDSIRLPDASNAFDQVLQSPIEISLDQLVEVCGGIGAPPVAAQTPDKTPKQGW